MGQRCKLECRGTGDQVEGVLAWSVVLNPGSRWAGVALQFVQSGRLKSNAPRDAHAGVWGLGADADAGRDSWTTQKPATTQEPDPEKPRPVRAASQTQGGRCGAVSLAATRPGVETATGLDSGWLVEIPEGALGNGRVPREPRRCLSKGQSSP